MHLLWSRHKVVYWQKVFFKSVDDNAQTLIHYLITKIAKFLVF